MNCICLEREERRPHLANIHFKKFASASEIRVFVVLVLGQQCSGGNVFGAQCICINCTENPSLVQFEAQFHLVQSATSHMFPSAQALSARQNYLTHNQSKYKIFFMHLHHCPCPPTGQYLLVSNRISINLQPWMVPSSPGTTKLAVCLQKSRHPHTSNRPHSGLPVLPGAALSG